MKTNAEPSRDDLADLSFLGPTWKYVIWSRARMKFGVRLYLFRIVVFLRFDRSKHALKHGFWYETRVYGQNVNDTVYDPK